MTMGFGGASRCALGLSLAAAVAAMPAAGATLPEDRSDALYHYYDGGGVKVNGPALLVRKGVTDNVSVYGRYYVDNISSASIDVVTTASPYKDKRTETGVGVDYLHRNSLMQLALTTSKENDYLADTFSVNVSHDLAGGLTTFNMGYTQGRDTVQRIDTDFEDQIDRYQYRLGLSRVLTRSLVVSANFEAVSEEGFLNNPYRAARVLGAFLPERYPRTRDSQAIALRAVKGLAGANEKLGSSVRLDYRYFWDTWDIRAHTLTTTLSRYLNDRWLGEAHYRFYRQDRASFYSDNFPVEETYMARDKELSTFTSHTLGVKGTYRLLQRPSFLDKATVNFGYDFVRFSYDDFTDVRTGEAFGFDAHVVQLYFSAWY